MRPLSALLGAALLSGCIIELTPDDLRLIEELAVELAVEVEAEPPTDAITSGPLDALRRLPVREPAPRAGYDRDEFGPRWSDIDHNGCDQRNDVLARDMRRVTYRDATRDCVVTRGRLTDPYTGAEIDFVRGDRTSSQVQIDHVVALSNAWSTGAQALDADARQQLANDPLNLLAVDGRANQSKGDSDASQWLPPNRATHCGYAARQVAVKAKYALWVTPAERRALEGVLVGCADARPTKQAQP